MKYHKKISLLPALAALSSCSTCLGFNVGTMPPTTPTSATKLHESKFDVNEPMSARKARVTIPLSTMASTIAFTLFGNSSPANAGIGSVVPFDVSRKEKFSGSIGNSVVMLRLQRSLRKRGYFYQKGSVATYKPKDDLGGLLTRDYADGPIIDLKNDANTLEEYLQSCEKDNKKGIILYGQDVDISPDGTVSAIVGDDLQSTEQTLLDKIGDRPIDITLMGGVIIHRAKTGGKDAGEDCFLPARIMGVRSNYKVDIFEEVFGDLPTSRQTIFW